MSNLIKFKYPEPQFYEVATSIYNSQRYYTTPYKDNRWEALVAKYNIKVPEIIDRSMGISKCSHCGTQYAGKQERCINLVDYNKNTYGSYSRGFDPYRSNHVLKECDYFTNWNLADAFNIQEDFFKLLNRLDEAEHATINILFDTYKESFSPDNIEALKQRLHISETEKMFTEVASEVNKIINKLGEVGYVLNRY